MKISHRDFRPPRRSRFVAQPPKRRPTLRILLLAGIGIAVYVKFDSVITSPAFQKLRHPGNLFSGWRIVAPDTAKPHATALRWAVDSSFAEAECAYPRMDSCFANLDGMDPEALGSLRAAIQKVYLQWNVKAEGGFTARFIRTSAGADLLNPNGTTLELSRLVLRPQRKDPVRGSREHAGSGQDGTREGNLVLQKIGEPGATPERLCAAEKCLDAVSPQPPFRQFRIITSTAATAFTNASRIPQADFLPSEGTAAHAVLPGRIVELPANLGGEWMKIYHGANIFSCYRGFTRMRPGLKNGSLVNAQDTLGFVDPPEAQAGDTARADGWERGLEVRIEKDGLLIDPLAWLGPQGKSADPGQDRESGAAHGR